MTIREEDLRRPLFSTAFIRILAIQVLFFGLLFLPEYSIYPYVKWEVSEYSLIMKTFQEIFDNPLFYGFLMIVTILMLFSFSVSVEEIASKDGKITMGRLLIKSLSRVMGVYLTLYAVSWIFLVYKLRFLGVVYINEQVITNLSI